MIFMNNCSTILMRSQRAASYRGERVVLPAVPPDLALWDEDGRLHLPTAVGGPQPQAHCAAHEAKPQGRWATAARLLLRRRRGLRKDRV